MSENNKNIQENHLVRNSESISIILKNITNEIAGGVSLSDFQDIITTLNNKPHIAKTLYNVHINDIIQDTNATIDNMYKNTDVDARYDELTKLINDSKVDENEEVWRPVTGDCEIQLSVYQKKSLLELKAKLEKLVQEERSTRILLKKCLDRDRAQVKHLLENMKLTKQKLLQNSENFVY